MLLPQSQSAMESQAHTESRDAAMMVRHAGKRRSCSGRYTLFSNEFKLHAVNMLEEGKSVAEVAKEVGLKNSNCLNYWKSIRDKLVTSERKRFRLAGGGRRSSCTFEDELLTWVSQRHQRGQGQYYREVRVRKREEEFELICFRIRDRHRCQSCPRVHEAASFILYRRQKGADTTQVDSALLQALLASSIYIDGLAGCRKSVYICLT